MGFVSPYRFTNMEELLKEKLGQPEVSREGNPKKFIDKADPRYQESIYAEPDSPPMMDPGNIGGTIAKAGGGIKKVVGDMLAGPWRSRTLETIEKNPKMPESASPQTWLSKLKGAGLLKDEIAKAESVLGMVEPRSKMDRAQLATALEHPKFLPTLGVEKTTLGGRDWEAGQKRIDELYNRIQEIDTKTKDIRHNVAVELGYPKRSPSGEYSPIDNKEITKALKSRPDIVEMLNEKQAALNEHIKLSQDAVGKRPKWPQYNIEGLKDYKEEYFHAPLKEGGTYRNADMEIHFADKPDNLLYLKHQGTLELPDGKKSTHMSTLQNDHAAEFEAKKYKVTHVTGRGLAMPEEVETEHFSSLGAANRFLKENDLTDAKLDKVPNITPEPIMLNTWWKHGLKSSIRDAVKAGHDYFTWDPAETQMKRFAGAGENVAQYMKTHYDNNIPGFLKKEYGVEAKKVNVKRSVVDRDAAFTDIDFDPNKSVIDKTQEVWQIPITDEIKKKVQEGQFWSKAARPGGKDAEGVA